MSMSIFYSKGRRSGRGIRGREGDPLTNRELSRVYKRLPDSVFTLGFKRWFYSQLDRSRCDNVCPGCQAGLGCCWEYQGTLDAKGYGIVYLGDETHYGFKAHRVSSAISEDTDPFGVDVQHLCNNPPCCRGRHLSRGTIADNNAYKVACDRQSKGQSHSEAVIRAYRKKRYGWKISLANVKSWQNPLVRQKRAEGIRRAWTPSPIRIAAVKALHQDQERHLHWRLANAESHRLSPAAILSIDDVRNIRRLYASGTIRQRQLALRYGVSQTMISRIVLGRAWFDPD